MGRRIAGTDWYVLLGRLRQTRGRGGGVASIQHAAQNAHA